jgi:hypothetical protein
MNVRASPALVLVAALACIPPPPDPVDDDDGGRALDGGDDGDGGVFEPSSCDFLDEAACAATAGCTPARAQPGAEQCIGLEVDSIFGGCIVAGLSCDDAITCAIRFADGATMCFFDGCLPAGFDRTSPCDVPAACPTDTEDAPIGRLCVRGDTSGATGEEVVADRPLRIEVMPGGCRSSSCTESRAAVCVATRTGDAIDVDARFCLDSTPADPTQGCTDDCGGGGQAACFVDELPAGSYTITIGTLSVALDVPSTLPFGGACDGDGS